MSASKEIVVSVQETGKTAVERGDQSRRNRRSLRYPALLSALLLGAIQPAVLAQSFPNQAPLPQLSGAGVGAVSEDYLLGAGDRVRIDFFNVPELSGEFQVLPNGTVNVPQIGSVSVRGRTLSQAENLIGGKAAALLRYPVVTVSLVAARPINIAVAGEVNQAGSYNLASENAAAGGNVTPTVTRMLRLAQGVTLAADLRNVQIRRPLASAQGQPQIITVDLWDLLQRGDISQDLRLRDGDSIYVPSTQEIDVDRSWLLAKAPFATSPNQPLTVSIVGEVNRPGPYTLTGEPFRDRDGNTVTISAPTVTKAIQQAGGITQQADVRSIQIRRTTRSGNTQETTLNFWDLLKSGEFRQDLPLQDGDTIVIAKADTLNEADLTDIATASFSPNSILVNVAGEVVKPGPVELKPNAPLNQALLSAGGYNDRAQTGQVTLLRLNPNGSVEKREINIDLAAAVNSNQNPPLRNGDTLVIARSRFSTATDIFGKVLNPVVGGFGFFNLIRNLFFGGNN